MSIRCTAQPFLYIRTCFTVYSIHDFSPFVKRKRQIFPFHQAFVSLRTIQDGWMLVLRAERRLHTSAAAQTFYAFQKTALLL
ncbi:MAG: hypothetical protein DBY40_03545 [Clostridiales bacterium]|nr:MAG: hypothetical protein DBY40_03545 [Clostridiales bacterium]